MAIYNEQIGKYDQRHSSQNLFLIIEEIFIRRRIDCSSISDESGLNFKYPAVLVGEKMYRPSEMPLEIIEAMLQLFQKENKSSRYKEIQITSKDDNRICYKIKAREFMIEAHVVIKWFTHYVATGGGEKA